MKKYNTERKWRQSRKETEILNYPFFYSNGKYAQSHVFHDQFRSQFWVLLQKTNICEYL